MKTETFNQIEQKIKEGWTFQICTPYRVTEINPKTLAKWEKSGHKLFKNKPEEDGFYVARGKGFDYVIPCSVSLKFVR